MHHHAAISAAQPNSSRKAPSVQIPSCQRRKEHCPTLASNGALAARYVAAIWANSRSQDAKSDFGALGAFRLVSRPLLGVTLRGLSGALRHGVVLLRFKRPCGVSVPPKTSLKAVATGAAQTSSGPRQESTPGHLGAWPSRWLCHV
jgi:hypothetical protein